MIHNVSDVKQWHKGTEQIGDTLFKDGTPYIACGVCAAVIRKVDAFNSIKEVRAGRDKRETVLKVFKVLVGHWIRDGEEATWSNEYHCIVTKTKWKPIIKSVQSCFDCWDTQQQQIAKANGKLVMYNSSQVEKAAPTKAEPMFPSSRKGHEFVVKTYPVKEKVSMATNTRESLIGDVVDRYIPSIPDKSFPIEQIVKGFTLAASMGRRMLKQKKEDEV